jgi:hypothetical protein
MKLLPGVTCVDHSALNLPVTPFRAVGQLTELFPNLVTHQLVLLTQIQLAANNDRM